MAENESSLFPEGAKTPLDSATSTVPRTSKATTARQPNPRRKKPSTKSTDTSGRPELTKVAQQRAVGRNARTRSVHKED